ncbi:hypothetical protein CB0940_05789 [Cercospora beticola]|uniref:FAD-binding PCMH-type domain-containing protein n=1 Tax=Cercospora beticola TaxID=122368 RepID=A0A2G5HZX5_CERBT|nr:hypothetical protein CB0940_05789 [Cercospora beticola]PIA98107.1 hypothetical protein CB0940_05789 [Cercospora beticola]WPA98375.1 hypothetical protein RHO25_002987 [Cercospora beticola]CAK1359615.1 unnamed protein product [Cercospora beticola]
MVRFGLCFGLVASLQASLLAAQANNAAIKQACDDIDAQFSDASDVLTFRGIRFYQAIDHWMESSDQTPRCVVQPASVQDLSTAMRIIGERRVPFAVMSGGHTSNPGFSSTTGVHISLAKLNEVSLSQDGSIARVGFGNKWLDVYKKLEGTGRNVVGGRVPGPGVGGFTLGGGYSWKTNLYGLTIDTIKSFTLVCPNGTIATVDQSRPDLFFALRGGLNRFGVVADAELYTHAQVPLIYGGTRLYDSTQVDRIINATYEFERTNTDPKATVITSILGTTATTQFFYDGPEKPASFAVFDGIRTLLLDTVKTQSFSDFVASIPAEIRDVTNFRGTWETFSTTKTTLRFLKALQAEAKRLSKLLRAPTGINLAVDAYIPGMYGQHAVADTSYPHSDSQLPVLLDVAWAFSGDDEFWRRQVRQSRDALVKVAQEERILHSISYSNYAQGSTPAQELYGPANAARLASIRNEVDPQRIMDLTGGYAI